MIQIKPISAQQTLVLRATVMKPWLRPEECVNPGDDEPTTLHFGAFREGELVGIATFLPEASPLFPAARTPFRLRGMASLPQMHRQGIGRALVEHGEQELRAQGCDLLWFNAREVAFPFYQSLGFRFDSEMFDLPRIGPHKVMSKVL